jgi:hypothetical protein
MEFEARILTDAEKAEKDIPDIIDNITDILVVPALIKGTHVGIKYFEESERIVVYIEGNEYLSVYIMPIHYHIVAVSDDARKKLYKAGHKDTVLKTSDRRWIFAILRRLV